MLATEQKPVIHTRNEKRHIKRESARLERRAVKQALRWGVVEDDGEEPTTASYIPIPQGWDAV